MPTCCGPPPFGRCARAGVARVLCVLTRTRHEWTIMASGIYMYVFSALYPLTPAVDHCCFRRSGLARQRWTIAVSGVSFHASGGPLRFHVHPFTLAVDHRGFRHICLQRPVSFHVEGPPARHPSPRALLARCQLWPQLFTTVVTWPPHAEALLTRGVYVGGVGLRWPWYCCRWAPPI